MCEPLSPLLQLLSNNSSHTHNIQQHKNNNLHKIINSLDDDFLIQSVLAMMILFNLMPFPCVNPGQGDWM